MNHYRLALAALALALLAITGCSGNTASPTPPGALFVNGQIIGGGGEYEKARAGLLNLISVAAATIEAGDADGRLGDPSACDAKALPRECALLRDLAARSDESAAVKLLIRQKMKEYVRLAESATIQFTSDDIVINEKTRHVRVSAGGMLGDGEKKVLGAASADGSIMLHSALLPNLWSMYFLFLHEVGHLVFPDARAIAQGEVELRLDQMASALLALTSRRIGAFEWDTHFGGQDGFRFDWTAGYDRINAFATLPDGRIAFGGYGNFVSRTAAKLAVGTVSRDGSRAQLIVDPSQAPGLERVLAMTVTQNEIATVGNLWTGSYGHGFGLRRIPLDGSGNATGSGTLRQFSISPCFQLPNSVVIAPGGDAIIVGQAYVTAKCKQRKAFALRVHANGEMDKTFGWDFLFAGGNSTANRVILDSQGRALVTGSLEVATRSQIFILRLLATGERDPSFGNGGIVLVDADTYAPPSEDDEDPDAPALGFGRLVEGGVDITESATGEIVVSAQTVRSGQLDFALVFLDGNGIIKRVSALDLGGSDVPRRHFVQPDGKILVAGSLKRSDGNVAIAVAQFDAEGKVSTGFGNTGKGAFVLERPDNAPLSVSDFALAADGALLVGGAIQSGSGQAFLARVFTDPQSRLDWARKLLGLPAAVWR